MTAIWVSVVLYRPEPATVAACISSLSSWQGGEVLVHCNDDADESVSAWVRGLLPGARVSSSRENLGFARAHNQLLGDAFGQGADAVVVHNPDLILSADAVGRLSEAASACRAPAIWGPLLELAHPATLAGEGRVDTRGIRWTRSGRHLDREQGKSMPPPGQGFERTAGVSGACMFVTSAAFTRVVDATGEFFDEALFAFREDAELCYRAALIGVPSFVALGARGLHVRGNRGTARGRDPHIDRLGVRNRFLIAFKYGSLRPGGRVAPWLRDVVVLLAVAVRERQSLPGVTEAWTLRAVMRVKGQRVRMSAIVPPRIAAMLDGPG